MGARILFVGIIWITCSAIFTLGAWWSSRHNEEDQKSFYFRGYNDGYEARSIDGVNMTNPTERIARLRKWITSMGRDTAGSVDILTLCDDYENIRARLTLNKDERDAIQRWEEHGIYSSVERTLILGVLHRCFESE